MRRRVLLFVGFSVLAACEAPEGDVSGVLALERDAMAGELVFPTCSLTTCHGADGNTGDGPKLSETIADWSDEELAQIIKLGFGDMPAGELSDQQVADVLAHLRQRFP